MIIYQIQRSYSLHNNKRKKNNILNKKKIDIFIIQSIILRKKIIGKRNQNKEQRNKNKDQVIFSLQGRMMKQNQYILKKLKIQQINQERDKNQLNKVNRIGRRQLLMEFKKLHQKIVLLNMQLMKFLINIKIYLMYTRTFDFKYKK
ncbi:unnamed protein product [Paramecium primaurelia]|uniref:Transmembrane protein n=1 Tax=Paramecium primaurelia TaxID=5886 RepID=A0A8S1MGE8_PARPR|nr:unnamed protein product [Paramecium primaurelia]